MTASLQPDTVFLHGNSQDSDSLCLWCWMRVESGNVEVLHMRCCGLDDAGDVTAVIRSEMTLQMRAGFWAK